MSRSISRRARWASAARRAAALVVRRPRRLAAGTTLGDLTAPVAHPRADLATLPRLDALHILDLDRGNRIVAPRAMLLRCPVYWDAGAHDNLVVIGEQAQRPERIRVGGARNRCVIAGGSSWPVALDVQFASDDGLLLWGAGATSNGTAIVVEGRGRSVIVGDDCMFAAGTAVRTSDLHVIRDSAGEALNPSRDVVVDRHVWVGMDAILSKGATVGAGAVIGARALVTGCLPPACLAVGTPARAIRDGIAWDRSRPPTGPGGSHEQPS